MPVVTHAYECGLRMFPARAGLCYFSSCSSKLIGSEPRWCGAVLRHSSGVGSTVDPRTPYPAGDQGRHYLLIDPLRNLDRLPRSRPRLSTRPTA